MRAVRVLISLVLSSALIISGCSKGGGGSSSSSGSAGSGSSGGGGTTTTPTSVFTPPAAESLSTADVQKIVAQAAAEAQARGKPAVIAVTDRVGNVLVVFKMNGAPDTVAVPPSMAGMTDPSKNHLLQNVNLNGKPVVPSTMSAIAKAVTGAYLSSGGNAFSTRTASMIVQQEFPPSPATVGLESGPLFGVQFSQLPCSDLSRRLADSATIGPKRSPLGLSADPGGFPLYKNGVMVGGIGVETDGVYTFDPNVLDIDVSDEENIALAGTVGFSPDSSITADRVSLDGTTLRYSDATTATLKASPASAPAYASLGGVGALLSVAGYYTAPAVLAGQVYGTEASGIRKATSSEFNNPDAFILTDGSGANRYPVIGGTDSAEVGSGSQLTTTEVTALLEEAFKVMSHARAQIRNPLNSRAEVTISVVDTRGVPLGIVRAPDAPIFGIDVSLQKARTVAFFSDAAAADDLTSNVDPGTVLFTGQGAELAGYVPKFRTFLNDQTQLIGKTAFSETAVGNLSRPYFPDGEVGQPNGPLSWPIAEWSPFATGLQTSLVATNIVQHVVYVGGLSGDDTPHACTYVKPYAAGAPPAVNPRINRLQNGLQIFPGGVPIYRGNKLVGGIGVSGDGIDQDNLISFLGLYNAGQRTTTISEAPAAIRADQIVVTVNGGTVRLRYVNCPYAPYVDSTDANVCDGK